MASLTAAAPPFCAASVAVVTSGYPMGAMMTSVVAGYIMPEYGWRGMFWFGGVFTLTMGFVAWMLIPESLKYLFERRPENALARVNGILEKLKKPTLSELPAVAAGKKDKDSNLFKVMLKLLAPEHRLKTITLWTAFFLCFSTLYFLMSWIPKLMEDSGYSASVGHDAFFNFNLGGVIGIYLMAWMSTRWKLSNLIFVLSFASAVGMVIFAFAPNQLPLLMALILVIGILQKVDSPVYMALRPRFIRPKFVARASAGQSAWEDPAQSRDPPSRATSLLPASICRRISYSSPFQWR